jgi:hypothetical protein
MADETEFTDEEVTYLEEHYPEHAKVTRWCVAGHPGWKGSFPVEAPPPRNQSEEEAAVAEMQSIGARHSGVADGETFHRLYVEALTVRNIMRLKRLR